METTRKRLLPHSIMSQFSIASLTRTPESSGYAMAENQNISASWNILNILFVHKRPSQLQKAQQDLMETTTKRLLPHSIMSYFSITWLTRTQESDELYPCLKTEIIQSFSQCRIEELTFVCFYLFQCQKAQRNLMERKQKLLWSFTSLG